MNTTPTVVGLALSTALSVACGGNTSQVTQRQVATNNGEARIVAEFFEVSGASETVVFIPSYARGASDFTAERGSDLAERVAQAGYRVLIVWPRNFGDGLSVGDDSDPS